MSLLKASYCENSTISTLQNYQCADYVHTNNEKISTIAKLTNQNTPIKYT